MIIGGWVDRGRVAQCLGVGSIRGGVHPMSAAGAAGTRVAGHERRRHPLLLQVGAMRWVA